MQNENSPKHDTHGEINIDESVLMEYRVIFLGDSEAGKTLIMSRMKEPQMNPADFKEDTTNGINIFSKIECLNGQKVRINYWDFGGQDILNSMHRMFLSKNTLYVIVLNTRNDNQDAQANFWIRYVQAYAPGAPLMLVMNKSDQNKRAALNLPALLRQFPILKQNKPDVLKISAIMPDPRRFRKKFAAKLFQRVAQCIASLPPLTQQQSQIRDALKAKQEKVVRTDDFRKICKEHGLKDRAKQRALMKRFNETGIMVYFGEGQPVLLDPKWITKAIYLILDGKDSISQNGIVQHETIQQLCEDNPDSWLGSYDANHLLAIMRSFDLSFQHEEQVQEFIPMLCQRREPEEIEELTDGTIEFQIAYEYLPSGVLYKMMVNHQKDLDTEMTWRTGAKIKLGNGNYAIIRQDGNTMKLYVHHANKTQAVKRLEYLAEEIRTYAEQDRFLANFQDNKICFEVAAGIKEYFDYDRLIKAKSANVEYVASKVKSVRVAVNDILDQEDRSERRELDNLLQLTLIGCKELQDNQTYWWREKLPDEMEVCLPKMNEDSRTRVLKSAIGHTFFVEDQHKGGKSATGISSGELDLRICLNRENPWSILEALNITEEKGDSKTRWLEHLKRLTTDYNQSGFRYLILVSYLLTNKEAFKPVKEEYHRLLRTTELENYGGRPNECEYEHLVSCPECISISRADYSGPAGDVSVFHFLVYIPEYTGKQEETTEGINKKEDSKKAAKKKATKKAD